MGKVFKFMSVFNFSKMQLTNFKKVLPLKINKIYKTFNHFTNQLRRQEIQKLDIRNMCS
jgi:hypothetical protein